MAVAILSPWPTTPAALTAARACLSAALGLDDDATTDRLGETAAALVEGFAPNAPQPIRNEAVIRCSGWLLDSPSSGIRRESGGPFDVSYSPVATGALRHSGAMGLLSPWKVRRAGAII